MGIGVPGEAPLKHRVVIKICRATCVQSPMTRATCRLVQQNSGPDKIVRGDLSTSRAKSILVGIPRRLVPVRLRVSCSFCSWLWRSDAVKKKVA